MVAAFAAGRIADNYTRRCSDADMVLPQDDDVDIGNKLADKTLTGLPLIGQ